MITQLELIDQLFLKDMVTNQDVAAYLKSIIDTSKKDQAVLKELESKLQGNQNITDTEKTYLSEILKNVMSLFRTYGKKSNGLSAYINKLK